MSAPLDDAVARFGPVGLAELDRVARLLHRHDRKYLVDPATLAAVLAALPDDVRALETEVGRWSRYASTYFDTPSWTPTSSRPHGGATASRSARGPTSTPTKRSSR